MSQKDLPPDNEIKRAYAKASADDPFLHDMQWPEVSVHSAGFQQLSAPERLYRLSRAYLTSALTLCESAGSLGAELDWPRASVCYYCLYLSTELFLKACIYSVEKMPKMPNHNIPELRKEYGGLFSGEDYFFHTPWKISAKDLEDLGFGPVPGSSTYRIPDQLYKYGMDKKGSSPDGFSVFTPGYLFNYMRDLEKKWEQIWKIVQTRSDG